MTDAIDKGAIAAIILAAGSSSRLGTPKQLVRFRGESLIRRASRCAIEAGFSPVVAITPPSPEFALEIADLDVSLIENHDAAAGVASSIKTGIEYLVHHRVCAAAILLCDQPLVTSGDLIRLRDEFINSAKPVAAAKYDEKLAVPAIFSRTMFLNLLELAGDAGARFLIRRMEDQCVAVAMPSAAFDVDTDSDLKKLRTFEPTAE